MNVLTEIDLRARFSKGDIREIHVEKGTYITPTARDFIKEKGLTLIFDNVNTWEAKTGEETFGEKPEYMTHLRGNLLVMKNHPRIVLRGKLDSLQAKILEVQVLAQKNSCSKVVEELQELLDLARQILSSEVREIPFNLTTVLGLDDKELREMSHNPKKHFGIEHILPCCNMGEVVIALNAVRTAVRETEIAAMNAFGTQMGVEREDLIKALNRLSSAVYVIICRKLSGWYDKDR